jgi:hypothetical protein
MQVGSAQWTEKLFRAEHNLCRLALVKTDSFLFRPEQISRRRRSAVAPKVGVSERAQFPVHTLPFTPGAGGARKLGGLMVETSRPVVSLSKVVTNENAH